ncbi:hypothetical protein GCM10007147_43010 [Nocardiopsis kunsanensis]|uniref:Mce-associated membrane protein n=1 Tax=Nocardiopsis kunsanensis TaxID=141693 RepID=A0A919CLH9_9ACTN|nr:hypothetical protein [Nocardiopsis kunsanensis]GHD36039.1 hypothetical protein GCM10007147_43010 [Nocardiopsis kunsanensis]
MPNPLPEHTQRRVVVVLIVVLLAFGGYFAFGGFGGEEDAPVEQETAQGDRQGQGTAEAPDDSSTVPPSPMPTSAEEDVDVLEWFPFSEDEIRTAGATARAFGEAHGTIDYTDAPEDYFAGMEELATDDYAEVLSEGTRAGAFWQEGAEAEAVAEGRAEVRSVRTYGSDSITFVVEVQSITETAGSEFDEERGEFAITVTRAGQSWKVHDFQPADVGQVGGE